MLNSRSTLMGLMAGLFVLLVASFATGDKAHARGGSCGTTACSTCSSCSAPTPPPQPPPQNCNCDTGGGGNHNIRVPGINVYVAPSVIVNAQASANVDNSININAQNSASIVGGATASAWNSATANGSASASASAMGNAGATGYGIGMGGGCCGSGGQQFYSPPMATGMIQGLAVESRQMAPQVRRIAYEATRTRTRRVIIQASCLDDTDVPHPASQVTPDKNIDDLYDGELYRCIAGARMQYVIADFNGKVAFEGGQTVVCEKNQALYHAPGSNGGPPVVACRVQKPARDCNERSLLRRFGAGVKILTMVSNEKYTAYREETVMQQQSQQVITTMMSLDGGVGGVAF